MAYSRLCDLPSVRHPSLVAYPCPSKHVGSGGKPHREEWHQPIYSSITFMVDFFNNNTPSLFVGQFFICFDYYSLYQYWQFTNCAVELFSSFRSFPVDCKGSTFFSPRVRIDLLSCCCDVLCGCSWKDRWRQTSKCDISRWGNSGRGKIKVFVHPAGIEPATTRLWDKDGTLRPLPLPLPTSHGWLREPTRTTD
jgi:hypothetical protein